jgi:competence protein ComEC
MAFGFRDVLSSPVEGMFSSLGLSHLLVVSGYQVSLVFGVVFAVVTRGASMMFPVLATRNVATSVSFVVASLYVVVVGSEMSALRALIAAACLCAALLLDRRHGFFQRWAVALLIMELVWTWAFFEIGVLLTFAALAGIGMGSILGGRSRFGSTVWVGVCVWLLTSAIVVMWSGTFSAIGVVLNLFLAGPWSVLNCTVGVVGILLHAVRLWPGREILSFVAFCNEEITEVLFFVSRSLGSSTELEGAPRLMVSLIFSLAACVCIVAACKRHRVTMATRLVR